MLKSAVDGAEAFIHILKSLKKRHIFVKFGNYLVWISIKWLKCTVYGVCVFSVAAEWMPVLRWRAVLIFGPDRTVCSICASIRLFFFFFLKAGIVCRSGGMCFVVLGKVAWTVLRVVHQNYSIGSPQPPDDSVHWNLWMLNMDPTFISKMRSVFSNLLKGDKRITHYCRTKKKKKKRMMTKIQFWSSLF